MFKNRRPLTACFLLVGFCAGQERPPSKPADQRLKISCEADSMADGATTYEKLVKKFGTGKVKKADIDAGEGETEPGAVIFPDDPERRLEVVWREQEVIFRIRDKSRWESAAAITLGTSLKQLEKINGKPFRLFGFAWDYGGTVESWNGGELQPKNAACQFTVRLSPNANSDASPERDELMSEVLGEQVFNSTHPTMQQLNPRAYEIVVIWELKSR